MSTDERSKPIGTASRRSNARGSTGGELLYGRYCVGLMNVGHTDAQGAIGPLNHFVEINFPKRLVISRNSEDSRKQGAEVVTQS